MKSENKLTGFGLLTGISASLCCITRVLALLAGTSGLASAFSWLDPLRPYLIGLTVLVLGFAWYQKLKPQKQMDCNCDTTEKTPFIQTKKFLDRKSTRLNSSHVAISYAVFCLKKKKKKKRNTRRQGR